MLATAQLGHAACSAGPLSPTAAGLGPQAGHPLPSGQLEGRATRQTLSPANMSITVNLGAECETALMLQHRLVDAAA